MIAPHDRREVGHAAGAAHGVEHAPRRRELRNAQVDQSHLRHDRVEHELRDVCRMGQPVALTDVRAVRDAVERPPVDTERLAQLVHVRDDVVGAVERAPHSQFVCAGTDGGDLRRCEVRAPHLVLKRLAVERAGARSSLVEHDDAVLPLLRRERPIDVAVEDRKPRLPRPARQHKEHPVRRVHLSPIPTCRCSVPRSGCAWSSGTSRVAHVNPVAPGQGWASCRSTRRADAGPATAKAATSSNTSRRTPLQVRTRGQCSRLVGRVSEWRRRESNPRPRPHRLSVYKRRLPFRFARRPVCSRPTAGLAILWCRASGDWLSLGAEPVR